MVETACVIGIDEEALLGLLDRIPLLWKSQNRNFGRNLASISRAVGQKDEMLFVFSVYSWGYTIMTLLSEYRRDLSSATIWIQANSISPKTWRMTLPELNIYELRMRRLFESLDRNIEVGTISIKESEWGWKKLFDALDGSTKDGIISFDEDFECPHCKARYSSKPLLHEDGKVQCQNCAKWISETNSIPRKESTKM